MTLILIDVKTSDQVCKPECPLLDWNGLELRWECRYFGALQNTGASGPEARAYGKGQPLRHDECHNAECLAHLY